MLKVAVFLLGMTLLTASPVQEIPDKFFSDNYSGLKEMIQGLLDAYNDTKVDLPSDCLSSSQQSKLDEDFVAMLSALIKFDYPKFVEEFEVFNENIAEVSEDCGLSELVENYNADVNKNGRLWILVNFGVHFVEIQADVLECLEHLATENWYKAGEKLGDIFKYVIPAAMNNKLGALPTAELTPDDVTEFLQGMLKGLTKNPSNPSDCYNGLETVLENLQSVLNDVSDYANGDSRVLEQFYIDGLALFNSLVRLDLEECEFDKLVRTIERLNFDQLMANYLRNVVNINAVIAALPGCTNDYNTCGEDFGMLFRMVIGWSL